MVASPSDSRSCDILVSVALRNDNPPVVDLSGAQDPSSINRSFSLNYTFVSQSSQWIAARDGSISDLDADGRIEMLQADLTPGQANDGIFLSASSGCPIDNSSTCHLR